ncbi:MAG: hypothetical protein K0Q70_1634, partial [Rhodospirillales bacterium]|nr:hypothetical protein [Rhodospirillales bacterium]
IFVPLFIFGAIALLSWMPAVAQEQAPAPKSPSQSQDKGPSQPPKGPAQSQDKSPNQDKGQAPKAAQKRNQAPLPSSAPEATAPATTAGCGWIGKRVIHSLLRDDAVTAQDFDRLYHTFNCSPDHLRASFDCTVAVGALPTAAEAQTRVDSCWTDPKFDTKAMKIAPANDMPTSSGAAAGSTAQPKSGAAKSAPPATGSTGGSTPNYPDPKPR